MALWLLSFALNHLIGGVIVYSFVYLGFSITFNTVQVISHITTGSFVGRGNLYIQLVKVLYCKLPTISEQLPTFPHKVWALNHQPQSWETSVLPLCHHSPSIGGSNPAYSII